MSQISHPVPSQSALHELVRAETPGRHRLLQIATVLFAAAIFVGYRFTTTEVGIWSLYAAVVVMAGQVCSPRGIMRVAAGCIALRVLGHYLGRPGGSDSLATLNTILGVAAIGLTTFLTVKNKMAETVLREQAGLLDLTHDTILARRLDGVITHWNRSAEELYGWTRAEAIGQVARQLLRTEFPTTFEDILAELLRSGRWEGELVHTSKDGAEIVVNSCWALQRDAQGAPALILQTDNDISERKREEEALRKAQAELARLNRITVLGEMTASIAHEVNQPLAGVITNANAGLRWLTAATPDLEEVRLALDRIVRDGHRASDVISRVRALARKAERHLDRLDINAVIREVLALTRTEIARNHVEVETLLADDLPVILGDRVQLQQVLINLIVNAMDAMRDMGDRKPVLTIRTAKEAGGVSVQVRDVGVGLQSADGAQLFQSFYTTKPDGMGLGLAISRSIIEGHGGQIGAAPNTPHGAIFRFTIPA